MDISPPPPRPDVILLSFHSKEEGWYSLGWVFSNPLERYVKWWRGGGVGKGYTFCFGGTHVFMPRSVRRGQNTPRRHMKYDTSLHFSLSLGKGTQLYQGRKSFSFLLSFPPSPILSFLSPLQCGGLWGICPVKFHYFTLQMVPLSLVFPSVPSSPFNQLFFSWIMIAQKIHPSSFISSPGSTSVCRKDDPPVTTVTKSKRPPP